MYIGSYKGLAISRLLLDIFSFVKGKGKSSV